MRIVTCLLLLGLTAAGIGTAAPEARESVLRWKLMISPDLGKGRNPVGRMSITPRKGRKQVYWYMVYTVRSTHDEAIPLSLNMRMTTDASDEAFNEGYYPRALAKIRGRWGDDVKDSLSLKGYELQPDETVTAVAIFQLFEADTSHPRPFLETADKLTIHVGGYADVVKRMGQQFEVENLELKVHLEKPGDQYDAFRESVRYIRSEEKVVSGTD